MLTRSYALAKSCESIHSSLLFSVASCIISLSIRIGSKVDCKGKPANWLPFKTFFSTRIFVNLRLSIEINAFLGVSNKVIGRVLIKLQSYGFGLGIGYIIANLQASGMLLILMHIHIKLYKTSCISSLQCLIIS